MTDVDRLLQTYIERYESGGSLDPSGLLEQAEGRDRAKLSALIAGYLEHAAPAERWDAKAFRGSVAERAGALVTEAWAAEQAALPRLLVARRTQARLQRSKLVEGLAEWLGLPDRQEKVARYYNGLEHGWLDPRGVSERVYEGLASLLDTSAEALRKAGESVAPSAGGEPLAFFARTTVRGSPGTRSAADADELDRTEEKTEDPEADWDEVDRLFRAG